MGSAGSNRLLAQHARQARTALDRYINEIGAHEVLSPEAEQILARRVQEGDEAASRELVARNLRFVVSVASRYRNRGVPIEDLIGEGNLGLIEAAKRFDPGQGVRFITYAVWWVRKAMVTAVVNHGRIVRLPVRRLARTAKLVQLRDALFARLGREPTTKELAMHAGTTADVVEDWHAERGTHVSLDAPVADGESRAYSERLVVESDDDRDDEESTVLMRETLDRALAALTEREANVISRYYGLGGENARTLEEVAAEIGLTRERVRQIRDRALARLRSGRHASALWRLFN